MCYLVRWSSLLLLLLCSASFICLSVEESRDVIVSADVAEADPIVDTPALTFALTIGGRVYALERDSGEVRWSHRFEPLLMSHYNENQPSGDDSLFIPSLSGAIYVHKPTVGLQKLGASAADIVASSPFLSPDESTMFVGKKETSLYTINYNSGELVRVVTSKSGFAASDPNHTTTIVIGDDDDPGATAGGSSAHLLLLTRADYTIVAVDALSGWNVTISSFNGLVDASSSEEEYVCTTDGSLSRFTIPSRGHRKRLRWQLEADSPVAFVYAPMLHPFYDKFVLAKLPHTTVVPLDALHFGTGPTGVKGEGASPDFAALGSSGVYIDQYEDQIFAVARPQVIFASNNPMLDRIHQIDSGESPTRSTKPEDVSPPSTQGVIEQTGGPCVAGSLAYPQCLTGFHANVDGSSELPSISEGPNIIPVPVELIEPPGSSWVPFFSYNPLQTASWVLLFAGTVMLGVQLWRRLFPVPSAARSTDPLQNNGTLSSPFVSPLPVPSLGSSPSPPTQTEARPLGGNVVDLPPDEEFTVVGKLVIFTKRVIGHGSSGTIVYEGMLDGRRVAVKRMLREFFGVAAREVSLLMESDEHPSVVSYYAKEEDEEFIYLALYLCLASLESLVLAKEVPGVDTASVQSLVLVPAEQHDTLRQLVLGLSHLHSLGIVHRDLKPHNVRVLVDHRRTVKLSDMGLARKLGKGQSSYTASVGGTVGWQAPELYSGGRISKAVDMFSLGCIFYFVLTKGKHPFGESFERELNIRNGDHTLADLSPNSEGYDLVSLLLSQEPSRRKALTSRGSPICEEVLSHPFFWSNQRKLSFMRAASDRIEVEKPSAGFVRQYEKKCRRELGSVNWKEVLDEQLVADLGKFRLYRSNSYRDLIRVLRNKAHHFRDLPKPLQHFLGGCVEALFEYFDVHFPGLFMVTYRYLMWKCRDDKDLSAFFGPGYSHSTTPKRSKTAPVLKEALSRPPGL